MKFDLTQFISSKVIKREHSLFDVDLIQNQEKIKKCYTGKRILVIGGAGTIGSHFIKALLPFAPSEVIVVDLNENGLTELVRDLRSDDSAVVPAHFLTYPVDFGSELFLRWFRNQKSFDVIANFAALKHVRSEKDALSVEAMIHNNVIKNYKLLEAMKVNKPGRLFCVSTDKAANPANVMGATKKLMEIVLMAYSDYFHISTARFANVAFSNGSLPDGFLKRLEKGQPLTAPLDIRRYFVSPKESGQLCMMTCALGKSGEIFFPKVNSAQHEETFTSIAENLLNEMGFKIEYCRTADQAKELAASRGDDNAPYPVYFFNSITSGEKTLEEFYTDSERIDLTQFESLGIVRYMENPVRERVETFLNNLSNELKHRSLSKADIVKRLQAMIPEFKHQETGRNLDQSM